MKQECVRIGHSLESPLDSLDTERAKAIF